MFPSPPRLVTRLRLGREPIGPDVVGGPAPLPEYREGRPFNLEGRKFHREDVPFHR
jgi:hypothetical protein